MHMIRTGEGPKLLLVHGLGSIGAAWAPIAPALAQGRELIAIDLPGHGGTPAESDSGTFAGLARSLEAFLDVRGWPASTPSGSRWADGWCSKWRGAGGSERLWRSIRAASGKAGSGAICG
jgi:pimeloyl-ACP methyl ester carboxylesterase